MSYVRDSKFSDIYHIAANMRKEDIQEIEASSGLKPLEALINGWELSIHQKTICGDNNEPIAMFGIVLPNVVWMLATDKLSEIKIYFLKRCRDYIENLQLTYPLLTNYVDERNTVHIKWLKFCGFKFYETININGYNFIRFERKV
jgi:hypothetical protein